MSSFRGTADYDLDNLRIVLSEIEIATYMELFPPLSRAEVIEIIVRYGPSRPAVEAAFHARVSGIAPATSLTSPQPSAASEHRSPSIRFEDWEPRIRMPTNTAPLFRPALAYLPPWHPPALS